MSIYKVAARAGVSKSTVSRVINGADGVSQDTARAVRSAMQELGYRPAPNRPGPKPRARPTGHGACGRIVTGAVGLVNVGRTVEMLSHPYFVRVQEAIRAALGAHGLELVLDDLLEPGAPACLRDGRVDAVLLTGRSPCREVQQSFTRVATVWISGGGRTPLFADQVLADNYAMGVMAAGYLASQGRRRLMFVNCDPVANSSQTRGEAFVEHARTAGLEARCLIHAMREPTREDWLDGTVRERLTRMLHALDKGDRPDGVFVPYDQHAAILQELLAARGVRAGPPGPGTDIVMISAANDASLSRMPRPIASIDPNPSAMAEWAVRRLLERVDRPGLEPVRMLVAPKLIEPGPAPA